MLPSVILIHILKENKFNEQRKIRTAKQNDMLEIIELKRGGLTNAECSLVLANRRNLETPWTESTIRYKMATALAKRAKELGLEE